MNDRNQTITISLAADDNYAIPLGITICSIVANKKPGYLLEIFVIDGGISQDNQNKIKSITSERADVKIYFLPIESSLNEHQLPEIGHLKKMAYARLFVPNIIDRERILYLDSDMIIRTDLADLFATNLDNMLLAAVAEPKAGELIKQRGSNLTEYYNSGLLLFNTRLWRQENLTQKCLDFIKSYPEKIKLADQDALNYLGQGRIVRLNQNFNYEIVYNEPEQIKDQAILHYIADLKPWHKQYPNSVKEYRKYAELSPWKSNWRTSKVDFKTTSRIWGKTKLFLKHIPGLKPLVKKILGRN